MGSGKFQRFVAGFVGVLLVLGVSVAIQTGDESMIGTVALVGALYTVFLIQFVRKNRERGKQKKEQVDSPLFRR